MNDRYRFEERMRGEWLTAYCSDPGRRYDPTGFDPSSLRVSDDDARDCARAIDDGIVRDLGGGRYRAARSSGYEVLFWEGHKKKSPRRITAWLEPVITLAALARLHFRHGWPKECLGAQSTDWAFDVIGYRAPGDEQPILLGEIKKSSKEVRVLRDDLLALTGGGLPATRSKNSVKKWSALLATRPELLWLVGPGDEQYIYVPAYSSAGATLHVAQARALDHSSA